MERPEPSVTPIGDLVQQELQRLDDLVPQTVIIPNDMQDHPAIQQLREKLRRDRQDKP
jgi:hypothetical protein